MSDVADLPVTDSVVLNSRFGEHQITGLRDEYVFQQIKTTKRFYENDLLDTLASFHLDSDALILDVGANIGNHTIYFASSRPNKILAFEPEGTNLSLLRSNLSLNRIEDRVEVHPVVVWENVSSFRMENDNKDNGGTHRAIRDADGPIASVTIDEAVGKRRVGMVKIDVEGAEVKVLRGALGTLMRDFPVVVCESHSPLSIREISIILEPLGYEVVGIAGRSANYIWAHDEGLEVGTVAKLRNRLALERERSADRSIRTAVSRASQTSRQESVALQERIDDLRVLFTETGNTPVRKKSLDSASPQAGFSGPGRQQFDGVREIYSSSEWDERVRVGIATIPGREDSLRRVLDALSPQVDEIFVYINGFDESQVELHPKGNVRFFTGPDFGDRAKFLFTQGFRGYYLTCDDDIEYPDFYVDSIVSGIESYDRRAIVGWHGSIFSESFRDYYNSKSRKVLSFSSLRGRDTFVHALGTGISGFHTSTLHISIHDFEAPNMADVFLALKAQRNDVPMVVLRHERGWAKPIKSGTPSISAVSLGKSEGADWLDVRKQVTELVSDHGAWRINRARKVRPRPLLEVAIIGHAESAEARPGVDTAWCRSIAASLRRLGVSLAVEDLRSGDPKGISGLSASVVIIQVGPEVEDFNEAASLVKHHAEQGRTVAINMPIATLDEHLQAVVRRQMEEWEGAYENRVVFLVGDESTRALPAFRSVQHLLEPFQVHASGSLVHPLPFRATEGVFLGDVSDWGQSGLSDETTLWTSTIRRSLPEAKLFAVSSSGPRAAPDFDFEVLAPGHSTSERILRARLFFAPKVFSAEALPIQVACVGVPLIRQLTATEGSWDEGNITSIQVRTTGELEGILPVLYRDPLVWRNQSRQVASSARSTADPRTLATQRYLKTLLLSQRATAG